MTTLIPLHDLARDHNIDLNAPDVLDPTGRAAYGVNRERIGTVRSALAEPDTGRLRYLLVDAGGWFSSKDVLIPVGLARVEDDGVYFDSLTREQVQNMHAYDERYGYEAQVSDERTLRGAEYTGQLGYREDTTYRDETGYRGDTPAREEAAQGGGTTDGTLDTRTARSGMSSAARTYNYHDDDEHDTLFRTPQRLRLLEERLVVHKDRVRTGSVEIGKHVENREQQVNVDLTHDELVIERHRIGTPRPVDGDVTLGADRQEVHVELEAERADVRKQAYVTEEVEVTKRQQTETQTFTETVGREVLDVNRSGDANVVNTDSAIGGVSGARGIDARSDDGLNRDDRPDGRADRLENDR